MESIATALILAGGKGERLHPLTKDRPKPMVLIEGTGRPILDYHLLWLKHQGIKRAVILSGYLSKTIEEYFAKPKIKGLDVICLPEDAPLGRGGAFKRGYELCCKNGETVIATNGDVITSQALKPMQDLHFAINATATMMVTKMRSPYGVVEANSAFQVQKFIEKPLLPYWINAGVYVLSREAIERFPEKGDHEDTTFPALASEGSLAAYQSNEYWQSIESLKDLAEASHYLEGEFPVDFIAT